MFVISRLRRPLRRMIERYLEWLPHLQQPVVAHPQPRLLRFATPE
jgi:hypothetical protein